MRAVSASVVEELRARVARQGWPASYAYLVTSAILPHDSESHGLPMSSGLSRWPALVLACAASHGSVTAAAEQAAVAATLVMTALDLLDDVEDGELGPGADPAVQVNVATGLLLLFHQLCGEPCLHVLPAPGVQALVDAALRACGGQHRDLLLRADGAEMNPEDALAITAAKSATLVAALCRLGALADGCSGLLLARYAAFGHHLGMALQLANDLAVAQDPSKADLARHRPTLPLVYAAGYDADTSAGTGHPTPEGALMATWVVLQAHRLRALRVLAAIERTHPARALLEPFLP